MLQLQIENDATLTFGTVTQLQALIRDAAIARLTNEDRLEYCFIELRKILALSPAGKFKVTRGGHHVALIASGYPHMRQAIILEARP